MQQSEDRISCAIIPWCCGFISSKSPAQFVLCDECVFIIIFVQQCLHQTDGSVVFPDRKRFLDIFRETADTRLGSPDIKEFLSVLTRIVMKRTGRLHFDDPPNQLPHGSHTRLMVDVVSELLPRVRPRTFLEIYHFIPGDFILAQILSCWILLEP
ncbi:hypothetical protein E2C01_051815 [Portunus trituberculatus]|uniref:Uncharacterized protein n=1 Tax=Portunus trituberculatus TaxID=210409 RepID=A0A5B7GLH2_PORTR|nr:hypothetical protein [Portunus trituberculatus]